MEENTKNWLVEADKAAYKALDYANKINPTFAETIKGIKNPLSEQDIDGYYKEDPYKGVIATALYLDKHIITPREFVILTSSRAVVIRCQIKYWTKLLNEEGIRLAFYASAGHPFQKRKPKDIETSAIFTLPPWELLHFIGYNLPAEDRPPVYNIIKHYMILRQLRSDKCEEWFSRNDDDGLVINKDKMDYIYIDYCTRCRSCRKKYPELEIIPWHGVMYSNKGTTPEYPITLYCKKELARDVEMAILNTLLDCRLYLEQFENVDIVDIEERSINGELFDVATLHIQYYNIFGRQTSQHLSEWYFHNNYRE
jgi:hypothetical protein